MKKYLFSLLLLINCTYLFAQLPLGSAAPDFTVTDFDGNTWHLQELLDSGQAVSLIFGLAEDAAQVNSGLINITNNQYAINGPNGSNEVIYFFVESNINNTADAITGIAPGYTIDYSTELDCPIIDADQSFLNLYSISDSSFFIYGGYVNTVICTLGLVANYDATNVGDGVYSNLFCDALTPGTDVIATINGIYSNCGNMSFVSFSNHGTEPIYYFGYTVSVDGVISDYTWSGELLPLSTTAPEDFIVDGSSPHFVELTVNLADEVPGNNYSSMNTYEREDITNHLRFYITVIDEDHFSYFLAVENGSYNYSGDVFLPAGQESIIDIYFPTIGCTDFLGSLNLSSSNISSAVYLLADGTEIALSNSWLLNFESYNYLPLTVNEIVPITLSGFVFNDTNENATMDTFETGIGNIEVNMGSEITYTNDNGQFSFPNVNIEDNTEISIIYDNTLWPICTTGSSVPINGGLNGSFHIGLSSNEPTYSLSADVMDPWFICGQNGGLYLIIENQGNAWASGTLTATLEPTLTYTTVSPTPVSFVGNTVVWNVESIPAGAYAYFTIGVLSPSFEQLGQSLITNYNIVTFDDMGNDVSNISGSASGLVNCSFDPNDKTGFPSGVDDQHYIHNGTDLEYLVRFQNTGNYQAFNIRIDDQLDSDLDFSTFEFAGSSHSCIPIINTETGLMQFYFDDINLPDSTTNEAASHGWLRYRISPYDNLQEMTTIDNTAYIYFDMNPAVITNTYSYTVSDLFFGVNENESPVIKVYPNPAYDQLTISLKENSGQVYVQIFDLNGRVIRNFGKFNSRTFQLDLNDVASGLYVVQINGKASSTMSKISVMK